MSEQKQDLAVVENSIVALEKLSGECSTQFLAANNTFRHAFVVAAGIERFRQVLTPAVLGHLLPLKDTPLGFMTDEQDRIQKGRPAYPLEVIRDCLIEAAIHGIYPSGNEFNILSGRFYITKNGFARKVRESQGMKDLILIPGAIRMASDKGAFCDFTATYTLNGKPQKLERKGAEAIPVRVNSGMGADAIVGKGERKMLAYIYRVLSASEQSLPDGEVGEGDETMPPTKQAQGHVVVDGETGEIKAPLSHTERVKAELLKKKTEATPVEPMTPEPKAESSAVVDLFQTEETELEPEPEKKPEAPPAPAPAPAQPAGPENVTISVAQVLVWSEKNSKTKEKKLMGYKIIADDGRIFVTKNKDEAMAAKEAKKNGTKLYVEFDPIENTNMLLILKLLGA